MNDAGMRRLAGLLCIVALLSWGHAGMIFMKARLAQYLLAASWTRGLAEVHTADSARAPLPWPWADTWPVARLRVPPYLATGHDRHVYVLAGAHGTALAFGPGLMDGAAAPGAGVSVIAGHRDTHFSFLEYLEAGDELSLQTIDGAWHRYRVDEMAVMDTRQGNGLVVDPAGSALVLVTCYPFDAVDPGGPLRYLVTARPVPSS